MTSVDQLDALAHMARALGGELAVDEVLEHVVEYARELIGADYAALGIIGQNATLRRFIHRGIDGAAAERIGDLPRGRGILGLLIRHPETVRLDDLTEHPASFGFPEHHPPMTSFLGTPIRFSGEVYGNLYLTDKPGGFTADDEHLVEACAGIAGAAIENAVLSGRLQELAVQEERDRISRDLHDGIIQTLYSIGMSLESTRSMAETAPDRVADRLDSAVDAIDGAIRQLRNTIFRLRASDAASLGLRRGIVELAREHEVNALQRPQLQLPVDLDARVPDALVPDLLQVVREALSNVARHAEASSVRIDATIQQRQLELSVADDGRGFEAQGTSGGHGLQNMRERAELHGGVAEVDAAPEEGTTLRVRIPLDGTDGPAD